MPYTIEQYLLDRQQITDTTTKFWLYADLQLPRAEFIQRCLDEVFVRGDLHVDYSLLLGTAPKTLSARAQAEDVASMVEKLDSCVHLIASELSELPLPGDGGEVVPVPETCAVTRKAFVALSRDGEVVQNGGLMRIEVRRVPGVKGNPWRIEGLKMVTKGFVIGDMSKIFA